MSEWWTYKLSSFLMFSARTYYRLLELHNDAWWPLQLLLLLPLVLALWSLVRGTETQTRSVVVLFGLAWCWVAWAFHWDRFADINWGARYVALVFGLQGLGLVMLGLARQQPRLEARDGAGRVGLGLLLLGLLYPLLAPVWGRPWAQGEWWGLMPDPTALATLGLLLCLRPRPARALLMAAPLLWCALAGATLWPMKAVDWFVLPLAGVITLATCAWRQPAA